MMPAFLFLAPLVDDQPAARDAFVSAQTGQHSISYSATVQVQTDTADGPTQSSTCKMASIIDHWPRVRATGKGRGDGADSIGGGLERLARDGAAVCWCAGFHART